MPTLTPTGTVSYAGGEALPTVGSDAYKQAQAGIIAPTPKPPVTPSPAPVASSVVNSKAATSDLNNIQVQHTQNVSDIQNQAVTVANNKVAQDAQNQITADKASADKQASDKLAIDKQNADTKAGVLASVNAPENQSGSPSSPNPPLSSGGYTQTAEGNYLDAAKGTTYDKQGNLISSAPSGGSGNSTIDNAQAQLDQANQQYQSEWDKVQTTLNGFITGTIPLTPGEQAQVTALQQQGAALVQQQVQANNQANGVANIRGYQTGAAEYDPSFQVKTIGSIVTAGLNKVADLNIKIAGAVADLTDRFKQNDIAAVKDAWDEYQKASKQRTDTLQTTIDKTAASIKDARDFAYKQQEDQRNYDMNVAKFQEQVNNDSFGQKATLFNQDLDTQKFSQQKKNDAFDQAYKMEDLALKKRANAIAQQQIAVPNVPMSASGSADKDAQKAFLATLPPATATAVQQLTAYKMNPADFSIRSVGGDISQRQQMLTLAHQYDPTFDENQYAARAAYLENLQSGNLSTAITSANKSIIHLTQFANDVGQLGNGGVSSFGNSIGNALKKVTYGSGYQEDYQQAVTESSGVKDELAKFFKGSGSTDIKSIDDWSKNLDVNATPGQQRGTVQGAINLLSGQLDTLNEQYKSTMGRPPDSPLLHTETLNKLSSLKDQGYEVNIPGVYYTDPKVYIANDSSAKDNLSKVVSIYPGLSQADALQLAQSLNE